MKKLIIIIALLMGLSIYSCRKNRFKDNITSATDNSIAENVFSDVFKQVNNAAKQKEDELYNEDLDKTVLNNCPTITITPFDTISWPKYIVIDFGNANCTGNDGRSHRGIINAQITGRYRDSGTIVNVSFSNYYIDEHNVTGNKSVTNEGRNSNNNLYYTIIVNNAVITKPDGNTIQWNSTREREWIEGETTIYNPYDDVYMITGGATGINSNNQNYTMTISEALNVKIGCPWVRSGVLNISMDDIPEINVDYGNGACDASATAIINGNSYPFTMN